MAESSRPPANCFVAAARHVYNPIGFSKGYNFVLWFVFAGALMGFVLARLMFLDYHGVFCNPDSSEGAAPGECWSYGSEAYLQIGMKLHLYTIIPGGFLACLQFVPVIRHKVIMFHRLNGYLVILLSLAGTAGAFMIANVSFGGGLDVQAGIGMIGIAFVVSLAMALYNIKVLQLEQHRAWMLRAWFYAGSIITTRIVMISAARIISVWNSQWKAMSCEKLASFYDSFEAMRGVYPSCTSADDWAAVKADMNGGTAENSGAALYVSFGIGLWISVVLHAVGIEIYLHLTPAEFERLRKISYRRQVEVGFKRPGRAGLTADRLGDSQLWTPARQQAESELELVQGPNGLVKLRSDVEER
ncbi:hypothetical protein N3K66_007777 [Trichothecium roseum]|uniref:Uncharacterized protein n=1 Tax=Trichothecium roseum TaxID=47278 RepID=A0ACC0UUX1_9HYPO|nr:hypothetical protein N3K66_007777 [Trichothecium roseum]